MYIVYKITNLINKEYYIGVHKMIKKSDNYMGSGIRITRSIEKYGLENFKEEALFIYETSTEAFNKEKELLIKCLEDKDCINIAPGGQGGALHNKPHSKEAILKMSKIKTGKKYSKESNIKKGDWSRGKTYKEIYGENYIEEKLKRSIAHKGKIFSKEHRLNISKARKGKKLSKEHRLKISKGLINKYRIA